MALREPEPQLDLPPEGFRAPPLQASFARAYGIDLAIRERGRPTPELGAAPPAPAPRGVTTGWRRWFDRTRPDALLPRPARLLKRAAPLRSFLARPALAAHTADLFLHWLRVTPAWQLADKSFYQQYEFAVKFHMERGDMPAEVGTLFQPSFLGRLLALAEDGFATRFHPRIGIWCHKMLPGQGIGRHHDRQAGEETHRIIIFLGDSFTDEAGGHLVFFNGQDGEHVTALYRPLHNTLLGFELTEEGVHAVTEIRTGERYTVIISLWERAADEPPRTRFGHWKDDACFFL